MTVQQRLTMLCQESVGMVEIEQLDPLVQTYGLRAVLLFPVISGIDITEISSNRASDIDDDG